MSAPSANSSNIVLRLIINSEREAIIRHDRMGIIKAPDRRKDSVDTMASIDITPIPKINTIGIRDDLDETAYKYALRTA